MRVAVSSSQPSWLGRSFQRSTPFHLAANGPSKKLINRTPSSSPSDYGEGRYSSNWGRDIPTSELVGLSSADMDGRWAAVHFNIVRSAGTIAYEGWFKNGRGSGYFTYQPNPQFVAELTKAEHRRAKSLGAVRDDDGGRGHRAGGRVEASRV